MVILALTMLVATPLAPQSVAPVRQARAMVRIIPGAKLRIAELEKADPRLFRESSVRSTNGAIEPAKLIEFE